MMMPIAAAVSLISLPFMGVDYRNGARPHKRAPRQRRRCGKAARQCRKFASEKPPDSIIDCRDHPSPQHVRDIAGMPSLGPKPARNGADTMRRRRARDIAVEAAAGDSTAALGVPETAAAPELREALAQMAVERDRLRDELSKARSRIASLERLADEDSLTPVANRRAFVRQLTRMIAFTHRYGVPASVVYFDVNNMKQINDAHGHPAGDAALRHIANVLRENIRGSDIVGRLGGDEFGVILAQTDEAQA